MENNGVNNNNNNNTKKEAMSVMFYKRKTTHYFMVSETQVIPVTIMVQNRKDFSMELLEKIGKQLQSKILPIVLIDKPVVIAQLKSPTLLQKSISEKEIKKYLVQNTHFIKISTSDTKILRFSYYFTESTSYHLLQQKPNENSPKNVNINVNNNDNNLIKNIVINENIIGKEEDSDIEIIEIETNNSKENSNSDVSSSQSEISANNQSENNEDSQSSQSLSQIEEIKENDEFIEVNRKEILNSENKWKGLNILPFSLIFVNNTFSQSPISSPVPLKISDYFSLFLFYEVC